MPLFAGALTRVVLVRRKGAAWYEARFLPRLGPTVYAQEAAASPSPAAAGDRMKKFVFACVHNAGRSQMAAAWFNALSDPARARASSGGTDPAERIHPEVVAAMREVGVDLAATGPRKLTDAMLADATLLVTMGCGEACPAAPGVRREDWPLPDPAGQPLARVRGIRDEIEQRVRALVESEGVGR